MKSELLDYYRENMPEYKTAGLKETYLARLAALERTPYRLTNPEIRFIMGVEEPEVLECNEDVPFLYSLFPKLIPVDHAFACGAKVETWTEWEVNEPDVYLCRLIDEHGDKYTKAEQDQLLQLPDGTPRCFFSKEPFALVERMFPDGVYVAIQRLFWEEEPMIRKKVNPCLYNIHCLW